MDSCPVEQDSLKLWIGIVICLGLVVSYTPQVSTLIVCQDSHFEVESRFVDLVPVTRIDWCNFNSSQE